MVQLSQELFFGLTLIVFIIVFLISSDLIVGALLLGIISNFFIIGSQLTLLRERSEIKSHPLLQLSPHEIAKAPYSISGFTTKPAQDLNTLMQQETARRLKRPTRFRPTCLNLSQELQKNEKKIWWQP